MRKLNDIKFDLTRIKNNEEKCLMQCRLKLIAPLI